ncbi:uncharacterized protein LOC128745635 [Sabethes cyaneus]|uniref:uncharacterized protein LOC128745635 n=1 Tax=Sabethes cyaneus TaxID=53552 RepID=UPI00237DD496|nr:uncharacterized protein LOC128745635 [Sabethes cyaneus]
MGKHCARVMLAVTWVALVGCFDVTLAFKDCVEADSPLSCYGAKMFRNVMKRLTREKSLRLTPGVEVIAVGGDNNEEQQRSINEIGDEREGIFDRIGRYLTTHELKINVGEILRRGDIQDVVRSVFGTVQRELLANIEEGRKKDKGGLGAVMMMGVMMSKLLGAIGFGSVAMLAMKALGVSIIALVMSTIIGLKKLTEGSGDSKGRQDSNIRVTAGEPIHRNGYDDYGVGNRKRRRRRSTEHLPYRGWSENSK